MFIIGREDWDLLQAVKDLGLTVEKVKEMDDPAPLPMMGNDDA